MPTPPTGVITWAASPIKSRPGRYQRSSLLDSTERTAICFHSVIVCIRCAKAGTIFATSARRCSRPAALISRKLSLKNAFSDVQN